ncbi:MAG: DNA polymerase III subunit alpha, partial [Planctomycetes bacterium DG_23]
MKKDDFVHLHTHSDYSLLDGAARIDDLVTTAKRLGMSALALTDHGNLFGVIEFYHKALEAGIKPIIGYEAYVAPDHRKSREAKGIRDASFHLLLLAKNEKGYKNLLKLASIAYLEGHYYKPRIDKEVLAEHSKGLVGLSGCLKSEVSHLILAGARKEALAVAGFYKEIFEDGCYFLEIQNTGLRNQELAARGAREIGEELGLSLVATNDVHYISPDDARAHDALLCINTGKILSDPNRMKFATNEFYFKTGEEMQKALGEFPEALKNTKIVADMCNLELDFSTRHLPHFQASPDMTNAQYLRHLAEEGLKQHYPEVTPEAKERLNYELSVIERMGLASYFLIVWDFVRFAKEAGIPVGLRGSGAGSFTAYALGITDIDPLKFDILFERFLDESRREFPDIDIDLCQDRREEVINYVREKYGQENVAQIITFGTLAARGALRDVGRVLNLPLAEVDYLAKKIPPILGIKLKEALTEVSELRSRYESEPEVKELFDIAMRLEGLARHASVHAAGVVIADKPLTEYVPLYRPPQGSEQEITTQYPMDALEEIGLLKMDFLGLATLTVIDKTVKMVGKTRGEKVDMENIPLDDKATFKLLSRGESKGVFQFESSGYRDLLKQLKPDRFTDIIALEALYRPGPMASGMVKDYVDRRHGRVKFEYQHPLLGEILGETYG